MSEITKPKRLLPNQTAQHKPRIHDTPGCCDKAFMVLCWDVQHERWGAYIESGGPGVRSYIEPAYFCPFCGTKLSATMPVAK